MKTLIILLLIPALSWSQTYKPIINPEADLYIAPVISLLMIPVAVEIAHANGTVRQRDLTALTGFVVTTGVFMVDRKIKINRRRKQFERRQFCFNN